MSTEHLKNKKYALLFCLIDVLLVFILANKLHCVLVVGKEEKLLTKKTAEIKKVLNYLHNVVITVFLT